VIFIILSGQFNRKEPKKGRGEKAKKGTRQNERKGRLIHQRLSGRKPEKVTTKKGHKPKDIALKPCPWINLENKSGAEARSVL
jgi:hypothetical protein